MIDHVSVDEPGLLGLDEEEDAGFGVEAAEQINLRRLGCRCSSASWRSRACRSQPWVEAAERAGVTITAVAETHIHNDYVTGGHALAQQVGATYYVNAEDEVSFERHGIRDGEEFAVGSLHILSSLASL